MHGRTNRHLSLRSLSACWTIFGLGCIAAQIVRYLLARPRLGSGSSASSAVAIGSAGRGGAGRTSVTAPSLRLGWPEQPEPLEHRADLVLGPEPGSVAGVHQLAQRLRLPRRAGQPS